MNYDREMSKPDLTILWLDDRRNPNTYFTNPLSTSASAERNREFYNSHIFNKYTPHFVCVKNRTEFQNYIENHGLPDLVSFDHDVTKDTNFQEYNGRAIARWLVQFCKDTNQPLPMCFVHSANRKRIPEMEDILGIPHIPLPDKPNSHMKNDLPAESPKEVIAKKSQESNRGNQTALIENIQTLMAARGQTQSSLARALGKQSVVINRALRGKAPISPKMQMEFAEHFGVTIEELNGNVAIPAAKNIQGFIKFNNGKTRDISSLKDLKAVYEDIVYQIEQRPKEVECLIAECKAIEERVKAFPHNWNDIDLFKYEEYNPKEVYCWSFRKANDERDNVVNALGNMCAGFPFSINGHTFQGSEQAYIAGLFSESTKECIEIQKALIKEGNGYAAKKTIRNRNERKCGRRDWEEFNVQWMLYVVWQKCVQNKEFAKLLKKVPRNAIIIENSALQTGETADFWGCKNDEWEAAFKKIADNADIVCSGKTAAAVKERTMKDSNSITCIGTYKGVNCMGKILTICRDCLLDKTEPKIDYELLKRKQIFIMGELMQFKTTSNSPLMGTICGDIIGVPYEFWRARTKDYNFKILPKRAHFSDDTVLTLAIAEWLTGERTDNRLRNLMRQYGRLFPDCGFSKRTKKWIHDEGEEPCGSTGNGAAMRVGAIGWVAQNIEEALDIARQTAMVTHNTEEGVRGAQAVASAIFLNRSGSTKQEIRNYIESHFGYDLSHTPDEIRPEYKFDGTCDGTVPQAISCWLYSDNYEQTIRNAVSLGGDADTLAAIAGSIAIATPEWTIPEEWNRICYEMLPDNLRQIIHAFDKLINKK